MINPMSLQDEERLAVDHAGNSVSGSPVAGPAQWTTWMLRPIVLFTAAYTIVGILHEWAHATAAYLLKVPFTVFHWGVNLDRAYGTLNQRAVIGVAGPLFTLGLGLLCCWAYRKAQGGRSGLLLLYLTMFGVGTFFGNLMSAAFVGDFSRAALALQLPMPVRYGASIVGALLLCGLSFLIGMELRKWAPAGVGRAKAMLGMVALPAIVGTAVVVLLYLPMPSAIAVGRLGEASFWIFGVAGILLSRKPPAPGSQELGVGWRDFAILVPAVVVVRVMAGGIAFAP